ncbi:MAG: YhjD/YihY/BrkB family envelope integrity protein, partial [bacterium]
MSEDHMGAYAATCAYFIILSFVPFVLIFIAISRRADLDSTALMNAIIQVVPSGIKSYVQMIISEVYRKPFSTLPISFIIVVWSAAKAFHALTNGLNVISKVHETRGWFYTRFRSMVIVLLLLG